LVADQGGNGDVDSGLLIDGITLSVPEGPVADFSANPLSGVAPLTVSFTDLSTGTDGTSTWSWDFGDTGTSTQQNPSHEYTSAGAYTVSLTVTASEGETQDTETKTDYITVYGAAHAEFSATPTSGIAPLGVTFTDQSTGDITSWSWDFGDSGSSSAQNPSHTYCTPGTYDVSLTVSGDGGTDDEAKQDYITVYGPSITGVSPSCVTDLDTEVTIRGSGFT